MAPCHLMRGRNPHCNTQCKTKKLPFARQTGKRVGVNDKQTGSDTRAHTHTGHVARIPNWQANEPSSPLVGIDVGTAPIPSISEPRDGWVTLRAVAHTTTLLGCSKTRRVGVASDRCCALLRPLCKPEACPNNDPSFSAAVVVRS
jgi:hypothetical protein